MTEEVNFDSLNISYSPNIKTYSIEKQQKIFAYLSQLNDINRKAYNIAFEHLGTSFNIDRSNGFKEWLSVLKFLEQLNDEDKSKFHYNNNYLFDYNIISQSDEYKNWLKK